MLEWIFKAIVWSVSGFIIGSVLYSWGGHLYHAFINLLQ